MHHLSVLSPFVFPIVVDVTESTRDDVLSELQYADDLFSMSEIISGLRNCFQ